MSHHHTSALKVSYCITCKGRAHHIKETLKANFAAEKDNPNVEFVLVDYDSRDGLADWIHENCQEEINSGRLKYVRYAPAEHFMVRHAKNIAHRMASGDVLCNLDADNTVVPNFSRWLVDKFTEQPHAVIAPFAVTIAGRLHNKILAKIFPDTAIPNDIWGRVAISKQDFLRLGGYEETFHAWGGEDTDLVARAREANMPVIKMPKAMVGDAIHHSFDERIKLFPKDVQEMSKDLYTRGFSYARWHGRFMRILIRPDPLANKNGNVGCGTVHVNFSETPEIIAPLGMQENHRTPASYDLTDENYALHKN